MPVSTQYTILTRHDPSAAPRPVIRGLARRLRERIPENSKCLSGLRGCAVFVRVPMTTPTATTSAPVRAGQITASGNRQVATLPCLVGDPFQQLFVVWQQAGWDETGYEVGPDWFGRKDFLEDRQGVVDTTGAGV